ncbi:MAG: DMT family transporter [Parvularculaceae bacterium]|nr:DMT family transporter [Parvularculaceae bacterium]
MRSPFVAITLAVLLGTLLDAIIKQTSLELSVVAVTMWRFAFAAVFAIAIFSTRRKSMPTLEAWRFHAMRGIVQAVGALSFFWSLTQIALAEATAIGFTMALFVPFMARVVLGEKLSASAGVAAALGFVGAVFALSSAANGVPAEGNRLLGSIAAFVAALMFALAVVLVRLRTRTDDNATIVMFGNLIPAVYMGLVVVILQTTSETPGAVAAEGQLVWIMAVGVVGFGMAWLTSQAYRHAEAQKLAPFEYLALPASVVAGWFMFGEEPHWRLYVGGAIIIGACLIVAFEDKFPVARRPGRRL